MKSTKTDISHLKLNHPGATDVVYRKRRKVIAEKAERFLKDGGTIPRVRYTKVENETWQTILAKLSPLHSRHAARAYLDGKKKVRLPADCVPQLDELSRQLKKINNFAVEPIGGLVDTRWFLGKFRDRTMLSTQYIRHHSRPDYTPEPDIVHECVGHLPMFTHPDFAAFSERVGMAALRANDRQLSQIERLYWFTMEFGLIREQGTVKAYGAGLLSSFGELPHAFSDEVVRKEFSIREVIRTPYSYTDMQPLLFVIPSFRVLKSETELFLKVEGL
jgi:phenylalanine-4-hydroxylase